MSIDLSNYQPETRTKKAGEKSAWERISETLNKDISFGGSGGLSDKKKERLYSELHTLYTSGLDIRSALELLETENTKSKDAELIGGIKDKVVGGMSLSHAIEDSKAFSAYEYYSLKIGEEAGKLEEILKEIAAYYERKIKLKRKFISAITYPAFVMVVAGGIMYFMLSYVVPMFQDIFARFGGDLPPLTKAVVAFSEWFTAYFKYFFVGGLLGVVVLYTQRKAAWFRKLWSAFLLKLPIFGKVISKVYLARFCQSMQLLTASKTPLVEAISLVRNMIGFYPIEHSLDPVKEGLMRGEQLHEGLARYAIYPSRMVSLIKVAEEVNQLDAMFGRLANQYSDEVEHQANIMGSVIEPLMIVIIAVFVGIILVAMYLPLFQLSSVMGA